MNLLIAHMHVNNRFLWKQVFLSAVGNLCIFFLAIDSAKTFNIILNQNIHGVPKCRILIYCATCMVVFFSFYFRKLALIKFCILLEKKYSKNFNLLTLIKLFEENFVNIVDLLFTMLLIIFLFSSNKFVLLMPLMSIFVSIVAIRILLRQKFRHASQGAIWRGKFTFILGAIYYFFDAMNVFYLRSLFVHGYLSFSFGIVAVFFTTKILHSWNKFFHGVDQISPQNIALIKNFIYTYDKN